MTVVFLSARRRQPKTRRIDWEARLGQQLVELQLPTPQHEYVFHATRKWRFDFAWPEQRLAVEFEGAVFGQGRHTRGAGFSDDCVKYNAAVLCGWRVLRFTERQVKDRSAVEVIAVALRMPACDQEARR